MDQQPNTQQLDFKPMKRLYFILIGLFLLVFSGNVHSQDLDALLNAEVKPTIDYTSATFKSTRIINGHSIEQMKKKQLDFRISHRFGTLNDGAYGLFGLDRSFIHFSLEYGIKDWLMVGAGRGSVNKTYDTFAKFRILRQSSGEKLMPVSLSYFTSVEMRTMNFETTPIMLDSTHFAARKNYFSSQLTYVHQILIARKFNDKFSFQLTPTFIHRNLVKNEIDQNDIFAMGAGARYKLSKRLSVNAEYFYVYNPNSKFKEIRNYNSCAIGVDIETGGHVFQIMLTNSQGMREGSFIPQTTGDLFKGDIHLGFNISRVFAFSK
jgi:opacity protein-like surface antigen